MESAVLIVESAELGGGRLAGPPGARGCEAQAQAQATAATYARGGTVNTELN